LTRKLTLQTSILATVDTLSIINCTDFSSVSVRTEAYYAATILGTVRLVASLALSRLLRSVPRRKMYFTSVTATAISLVGVATFSCVVVIKLKKYSTLNVYYACFILGKFWSPTQYINHAEVVHTSIKCGSGIFSSTWCSNFTNFIVR